MGAGHMGAGHMGAGHMGAGHMGAGHMGALQGGVGFSSSPHDHSDAMKIRVSSDSGPKSFDRDERMETHDSAAGNNFQPQEESREATFGKERETSVTDQSEHEKGSSLRDTSPHQDDVSALSAQIPFTREQQLQQYTKPLYTTSGSDSRQTSAQRSYASPETQQESASQESSSQSAKSHNYSLQGQLSTTTVHGAAGKDGSEGSTSDDRNGSGQQRREQQGDQQDGEQGRDRQRGQQQGREQQDGKEGSKRDQQDGSGDDSTQRRRERIVADGGSNRPERERVEQQGTSLQYDDQSEKVDDKGNQDDQRSGGRGGKQQKGDQGGEQQSRKDQAKELENEERDDELTHDNRKEQQGSKQTQTATRNTREILREQQLSSLNSSQKKSSDASAESSQKMVEFHNDTSSNRDGTFLQEQETFEEKNEGEQQQRRREGRHDRERSKGKSEDEEEETLSEVEAASNHENGLFRESLAILSVEDEIMALEQSMSNHSEPGSPLPQQHDYQESSVDEDLKAVEMRYAAENPRSMPVQSPLLSQCEAVRLSERSRHRIAEGREFLSRQTVEGDTGIFEHTATSRPEKRGPANEDRNSTKYKPESEDIQPVLIKPREIYMHEYHEAQISNPVKTGNAPGATDTGLGGKNAGDGLTGQFFESILEESDVMKAFKLSSRAYHFITFIFEDLLKRKLRTNGSSNEYFTQYVLLLMRISGEFTFAHSLRTQSLALNLARKANIRDKEVLEQIRMGALFCDIGELHEHFAEASEEDMKKITQFLSDQDFLLAGVLHDIGKIRIPQEILYKPGSLTDQEFKTMKMHPIYSEMILYPIQPLRHLCPVVRAHHEKWDGKGYPDGTSGAGIPLAARIIAIADVFDALISDRPYKKGMPFAKAKRILEEGRGTHFDPHLLDIFLSYITPLYEGE